MADQKTWIDYRMEELEEKAGVDGYPEYDMDGSRFEVDVWTTEMDDAYSESVSWRMGWLMGIVHPDELPDRLKARIKRRTPEDLELTTI